MSKLSRYPIEIPAGVTVSCDQHKVTVASAKAQLVQEFDHVVEIVIADQLLRITTTERSKYASMQSGTAAAIIKNMIIEAVESHIYIVSELDLPIASAAAPTTPRRNEKRREAIVRKTTKLIKTKRE